MSGLWDYNYRWKRRWGASPATSFSPNESGVAFKSDGDTPILWVAGVAAHTEFSAIGVVVAIRRTDRSTNDEQFDCYKDHSARNN